jgi:hypothetical protein
MSLVSKGAVLRSLRGERCVTERHSGVSSRRVEATVRSGAAEFEKSVVSQAGMPDVHMCFAFFIPLRSLAHLCHAVSGSPANLKKAPV